MTDRLTFDCRQLIRQMYKRKKRMGKVKVFAAEVHPGVKVTKGHFFNPGVTFCDPRVILDV